MTDFSDKVSDFKKPTQLPNNDETSRRWQEQNKGWWEAHPMQYDWSAAVGFEPGTRAYYDEIDARFFKSASEFLPFKTKPFDSLIDYANLGRKDVLEIGVGMGSHAQLLAAHAKSYTGIDLTERAAETTRKRLEQAGLPARILQMDAEKMTFENESFDHIWSWGVIHHSSNTDAILKQMHRVLRPGGSATVMVYYRSFWVYWVQAVLVRGLLLGQVFKYGSFNSVLNVSTDGAIARFYTAKEWKKMCFGLFEIKSWFVCGPKPELFLIPRGKIKSFLLRAVPDAFTRFITNNLRFGSFLVVRMEKKRVG